MKKKKNIFKPRYYQHIDKVIDIKDIEKKIKNKDFVIKHGFYPFLSYIIEFKKFSKEINENTNHHWKIKKRPIKYAAHIDRYIYQWYSYNLNNCYNEYCRKNDLNDSAIAYRTCLKGETNINFAAKAIDFIKRCGSCYILVSDFSSFFDFISHKKLKNNMCKVLNVEKLEDDWYRIFKSMTRYSYVERYNIEEFLINNGIETKESIKTRNSLFDNICWKDAKKKIRDKIIINKEEYGIPQGSPLSGIFANVYMIDFDIKAREYAKSKNGLYMRYSDDLIMIVPKNEVSSIRNIWEELSAIKEEYPTLKMNIDKTSGYVYENNQIVSLHEQIDGMQKGGKFISYLGFSFDGKYVRFRDKTFTKFFYKLYRKIDSMVLREKYRLQKGRKRHTKIDKHRILKELDSSQTKNRKFFDYVNRAKKVFPNEYYIVNFRKNIKSKVFERFEKKRELIKFNCIKF